MYQIDRQFIRYTRCVGVIRCKESYCIFTPFSLRKFVRYTRHPVHELNGKNDVSQNGRPVYGGRTVFHSVLTPFQPSQLNFTQIFPLRRHTLATKMTLNEQGPILPTDNYRKFSVFRTETFIWYRGNTIGAENEIF